MNELMTLPLKPFYFLRHGETDWNRKGLCMGNRNIPLNETGRSQAYSVHQRIQDEPIDQIVSSPLMRALETARIVNQKLGLTLTILDALRECHIGSAEETAFEMRVFNGFKQALALGKNVLIVSHGDVYSTLSGKMGWPISGLRNCELIFHKPPLQSTHPWSVCSLSD